MKKKKVSVPISSDHFSISFRFFLQAIQRAMDGHYVIGRFLLIVIRLEAYIDRSQMNEAHSNLELNRICKHCRSENQDGTRLWQIASSNAIHIGAACALATLIICPENRASGTPTHHSRSVGKVFWYMTNNKCPMALRSGNISVRKWRRTWTQSNYSAFTASFTASFTVSCECGWVVVWACLRLLLLCIVIILTFCIVCVFCVYNIAAFEYYSMSIDLNIWWSLLLLGYLKINKLNGKVCTAHHIGTLFKKETLLSLNSNGSYAGTQLLHVQ